MKAASLALLLVQALAMSACSTPASRSPASFCHPTASDEQEALRILAEPGKFEVKRKSRLKAMVQAYMLAAELTHDFDGKLDRQVPIKEIFASDTYLRLQALHLVRKSIRHSLEDIYLVRINRELKENPGASRESVIVRNVEEVQRELEELIRSAPESHFARIALLDVAESFEDLRDYYVTCDHAVFERNFDRRLEARKAAVAEIAKSAPLVAGAYKAWEPKEGEKGLHVAKIVEKIAGELRTEIRFDGPGREPQSAAVWAPGTGSSGNIVGGGFPKNTWALTYDDGPAGTTPRVLDNLQTHGIKATFFMLSQQIRSPQFKETALRVRADGHAIASHSITHPQVPKLSAEGRQREIVGAADIFAEHFGERPAYFRLPYGAGTNVPAIRKLIADAGMIHVFWNVDTLDWHDKNPELVYQRALKQVKQLGRGVILFHDIHPQSVIASEKLMQYLKDPANGIRTVTIPEIVTELNAAAAAAPATPAP